MATAKVQREEVPQVLLGLAAEVLKCLFMLIGWGCSPASIYSELNPSETRERYFGLSMHRIALRICLEAKPPSIKHRLASK